MNANMIYLKSKIKIKILRFSSKNMLKFVKSQNLFQLKTLFLFQYDVLHRILLKLYPEKQYNVFFYETTTFSPKELPNIPMSFIGSFKDVH